MEEAVLNIVRSGTKFYRIYRLRPAFSVALRNLLAINAVTGKQMSYGNNHSALPLHRLLEFGPTAVPS